MKLLWAASYSVPKMLKRTCPLCSIHFLSAVFVCTSGAQVNAVAAVASHSVCSACLVFVDVIFVILLQRCVCVFYYPLLSFQ